MLLPTELPLTNPPIGPVGTGGQIRRLDRRGGAVPWSLTCTSVVVLLVEQFRKGANGKGRTKSQAARRRRSSVLCWAIRLFPAFRTRSFFVFIAECVVREPVLSLIAHRWEQHRLLLTKCQSEV